MASDQSFVDYIVSQLENVGDVTARKMFGEYALYKGAKLFALVCDNKLFVKPTAEGREFIVDVKESPAYPGAKPAFLIEEKLDDSTWLCTLVNITAEALPEPKPKKKKLPKK